MGGTTMKDEIEKNNIQKENTPLIGLRWIFVLILHFSYVVIFFVRNSFPVTLVAMINGTVTSDVGMNSSQDACPATKNSTPTYSEVPLGEFNWSASEQGIILGAYFWGFVLSRLFFSRVGEVVGQRATVITGMTLAGFLSLLSPAAASFNPNALAVARFFTGMSIGPVPASFQSLLSAWAPRNELATMSSTSYSGSTLGSMLGLFVGGWLTNQYGWRVMFYLGGSLMFVILPFWIYIIRNSPFDHPWLTDYEKKLLDGNKKIKTKKTVPWADILTSPYVMICIYALFARAWLDGVMSSEGPSYFKYKIGLDLNTASYVSGFSYLNSMICMLIFGRLSDYLINKNYLTKIQTRKLFHLIGSGGAAVVILAISFVDCNATATVVLWILIGGVSIGTAVSYSVSIIDIAPIFTATISGLMALGNIGAALAPVLTSYLIQTGYGWNESFYIAAGLSMVSCILYVTFMTAEPQPWNFYEDGEETTKF